MTSIRNWGSSLIFCFLLARNFYTYITDEWKFEIKTIMKELFIDLCTENELVITNRKFQLNCIHKYTREFRSRNKRSIIDYFLKSKNQFKLVNDITVRRELELVNDHSLLRSVIRTDIRNKRAKEEKRLN